MGRISQGTLASEFARTCLHIVLVAELRTSQLSTSTASTAFSAASASARAAVADALRRAIVRVDGSFLQRTLPEVVDGSTVLVVLQWGAHLLAANVGDSPAYLCPPTTLDADDTTPTLLTEYVAAAYDAKPVDHPLHPCLELLVGRPCVALEPIVRPEAKATLLCIENAKRRYGSTGHFTWAFHAEAASSFARTRD